MFLCLCRSRSMSWLPGIPLYHSQAVCLSIFFYFWAGCGPLSLFHIPAAVCASSSIPQGFFLSREPLISLWDLWHGCSSPQVMFSSCCLFSFPLQCQSQCTTSYLSVSSFGPGSSWFVFFSGRQCFQGIDTLNWKISGAGWRMLG